MPKLKTSTIFIPGNVPSLKNNKQIVTMGKRCPVCKKGNLTRLVSSKRVQSYIKETHQDWEENREEFMRMLKPLIVPYRISFLFVRESRHKFDYSNALDTVQDVMVSHSWLSDDNSEILLPVLLPYRYDKENPGVWISVDSSSRKV